MNHITSHPLIIMLRKRWKPLAASALALVFLAAGACCLRACREDGSPIVGITHSERIEPTAEQVMALRDIGQWEFLSVETEELVEHHEARTFGDHHLVKIYRGRLSLGVDMQQTRDGWFRDSLSTAIVTLPPIGILDDQFIDEARTVTFYEKGRFSAATQQRLYDKAAAAMRRRALAPANIAEAESSAREHFTRLLRSLGYKEVVVRFGHAGTSGPSSGSRD